MPDKLMVVEEAHPGPGRGVVLSPRFVPPPSLARALTVRLKLPDGRERTASAELQVSHMRGPLPPYALLRLADVGAAEVPPGTEVWTTD
jgi:hypothetical protein